MGRSQLSEICNHLIELLRRQDLLKRRHPIAAICNSQADILFGCRFGVGRLRFLNSLFNDGPTVLSPAFSPWHPLHCWKIRSPSDLRLSLSAHARDKSRIVTRAKAGFFQLIAKTHTLVDCPMAKNIPRTE